MEVKLFSGTKSQYLAETIADHYGDKLGSSTIKKFSDGEMQPVIMDSVRGAYVWIHYCSDTLLWLCQTR